MQRRLLLALLLAAALPPTDPASGGALNQPYIDPSYLTVVPFGGRSQWIQPWRAYLETMPASVFVNGIGVVCGSERGADPELIDEMLAKHGMTSVRIESGWGGISYSNDFAMDGAEGFVRSLRQFKRNGLRPIILLNAHQGVPCPMLMIARTVTADAAKGDSTVVLDNVDGLIVGRSGLSNLSDYWAAEALITKIDRNTVTLSKPLPKAIAKGTLQLMATLKYRPFGPPDDPETKRSVDGWQHYVLTIARLAVAGLGTAEADDKGFDLEVWNELTFGSNFLSINHYYAKPFAHYEENSIMGRLVSATAQVAVDNPQLFAGVQICDGFANTLPWQASSTEPPRVIALSHHPYPGFVSFPHDAQKASDYNALMQPESKDKTFEPTYTAWFPEYAGTLLQTEEFIRDTAPITTEIYGTKHGRWARDPAGSTTQPLQAGAVGTGPFQTWYTEFGMGPDGGGIVDRQVALDLKARAAARSYCFWTNKGLRRLMMFQACEGDLSLGVVQDNFIQYAKTHRDYPADDSQYLSPMLRVIGRIAAKMRDGLTSVQFTQPIRVDRISDEHDHVQFIGDGTTAHPNLFDRDVLTILPFQVNDHRLLIAYYVMTRDLRKKLPVEGFTVQFSGFHGGPVSVSGYDPIEDKPVDVRVLAWNDEMLKLQMPTTDYPYLMILDEPRTKDGS